MSTVLKSLALMAVTIMAAEPTRVRATELGELTEGRQLADFTTETLYEDATGGVMGARFRHNQTGMVLDVLRIQTVPGAFVWVNSFPPSDQGEPHTCEHLLLGKGTKGRYVASLEDMSLGSSSAFTMQLQTCYHYHTAAGPEIFWKLMEAKLDAMLQPTYSDEEIRREVCNIGYRIDPADSSLVLEEKGTVYNEMVSSFERPWSNLGVALDLMLFGPNHPLSNSSGGIPDQIRTMTPEDLRRFHTENYRLGNLGIIVSLPADMDLDPSLQRMSEILARVQPKAELDADPAAFEDRLPPPQMAPAGEIRISHFPNQDEDEPGLLVYAWPSTLHADNNELYMLELLFENVAGGETSDLYRMFIDSKTRSLDIGANAIFNWIGSEPGHPIYVGFNNVSQDATSETMIDSIRGLIQARLAEIAGWAPGSDELAQFNERTAGRILEGRRGLSKFLNSPPGFGFRSSGAGWFEHLRHLQRTDGFRKSLALEGEFAYAESLLATDANFWSEYIDRWNLISVQPYAVAARPDPEMIAAGEAARDRRVESFVQELETTYGVTDASAARERYRAEYDEATAVIDAEAATIEMPRFVDTPPLTLDDQLDFRTDSVDGVPAVVSTFENITSGTVGIAFNLDVIDSDQLVYVPALPTMLTDVGVVRDGIPLPYDEMKEAIRREILSLSAYFSVNYRTRRAELVVKGAGSNLDESRNAVDWMSLVLTSPDWRTDNLGRIRDAIDLSLKSRRNTMRWREEAWVQDPARAWWQQTDPVLLTADCFLTQTHALHRLRWMLKDPVPQQVADDFNDFVETLTAAGQSGSRDEILAFLEAVGGDGAGTDQTQATQSQLAGWPERAAAPARDMLADLKLSLGDIPDETLAGDWKYLCKQMAQDLERPPGEALGAIDALIIRLLRRDNARTFVIASSSTQEQLQPKVNALLDGLDTKASKRKNLESKPIVTSRLAGRRKDAAPPRFVGLINENTRSGVFVNTAHCASYEDTDQESLLNFLSARLYGGGGAHSMFMKTWGAGLAYSNGLRSNENTGRLIYYAERCPDLAQTMQFVVDQLKTAPFDTTLAEYAVAQAFSAFRSGRRYEERGEAMAADLADGLTPDVVRNFRRGVLALRDRENLYEELHNRMPSVYGEVLPGFGVAAAQAPGANYFVIGPEAQFESYEEYLKSVESPDAVLVRLYPRDFWIIRSD